MTIRRLDAVEQGRHLVGIEARLANGLLPRPGRARRETAVGLGTFAQGVQQPRRALETAGLDPLAAALAGAAEVGRLTELVGIPTLSELGFSADEIPMLARMAFDDPQTIGNPRELGVADYEVIYEAAFAS